mgnify:FL=1
MDIERVKEKLTDLSLDKRHVRQMLANDQYLEVEFLAQELKMPKRDVINSLTVILESKVS